MVEDIGLFDAIYTQRAIRSFKPDRVPRPLLERVLEAATKAPSAANSQPWAFVVVEDPASRAVLHDIARRRFEVMYAGALARQQPGDPPPMPNLKKMVEAIDSIPVWIIVCAVPAPGTAVTPALYGSVFPAVQNLLLAARGVGLGAVLTGLFGGDLPTLRATLGIPEEVEPLAFVPLGYPDGQRYGPRPGGPSPRSCTGTGGRATGQAQPSWRTGPARRSC